MPTTGSWFVKHQKQELVMQCSAGLRGQRLKCTALLTATRECHNAEAAPCVDLYDMQVMTNLYLAPFPRPATSLMADYPYEQGHKGWQVYTNLYTCSMEYEASFVVLRCIAPRVL